MTEAIEQEIDMDSNGILLFSEQDTLVLDKIERLERKMERLERILTKLGKVVVKHLTEPEDAEE